MTFVQRPLYTDAVGTLLTGRNVSSLVDPVLGEDARVFNVLYHETEIHVPHEVLDVSGVREMDYRYADCLDLPVRLKSEDVYSIPDNWKELVPVIQHIIDVEHSNNPNWKDYYTYLSVHYDSDLVAGQQQRHAGCHTDGFQGARVKERTKTSRSYVAVTNGGTRVFPQTFVANLDATKFNVFEGFDLQVEKTEDGSPVFEVAEEKKFYFFDAYAVHEAGAAERDGARLFVRLTWEQKLFDRAENTKNRMIDYDWQPEPYDIRSDLMSPTWDDVEAARMVR